MTKNFLLLIVFISLSALQANEINFSHSKKLLLKQVYHDNKKDFYCDNPYNIAQVNGREKTLVIPDVSKYSPRKPNRPETKFINWEHVMPANRFGQNLDCWKKGGRKGCKNDLLFNQMESDMHNLTPSIAEINSDRGNFNYGNKIPSQGQYGNCKAESDFRNKLFYPKEDIRGDIARIYFYMSEKYKIGLSADETAMFKTWNKNDPVSQWEKIKNQRVKKLQGNDNRFVEK